MIPGQPAQGDATRALARSRDRQLAKRAKITAVAMEEFAAHGYEGTRAEAVALAAGVSKGAIFGYFGSKAGLFLAAYQAATLAFGRYLDAPPGILADGFFATLTYWLEHTPGLMRQAWAPYRVVLIGSYCSDLGLKREIDTYMRRADPYGTADFVRFGQRRGEVRTDIDVEPIIALVDWTFDRCQDVIVATEPDPGILSNLTQSAVVRPGSVEQFVQLLRSAIAVPAEPGR